MGTIWRTNTTNKSSYRIQEHNLTVNSLSNLQAFYAILVDLFIYTYLLLLIQVLLSRSIFGRLSFVLGNNVGRIIFY